MDVSITTCTVTLGHQIGKRLVKPLRFRYETIEFGDLDIHVRSLRDKMQFEDIDDVASALGISSAAWPISGVIWEAGMLLAQLMLDFEIEGKKILELGCGIALASLVLNHREADITSMDHHPEVGNFLRENTRINKGREIPFVRAGWEGECSDLGRFDLLIGSDLLYEREHAGLLSNFIDQHANPVCEVILVDPGRRYRAAFSKKMQALGYLLCLEPPKVAKDSGMHVLCFRRESGPPV